MSPRTALCHDWLNGMRGGEKCLEVFCELYPDSTIFTLFHEKGKISHLIADHTIKTSFLQKAPKIYLRYRHYLPLFPLAMEGFDLTGYDLVLSTGHCVAKGFRKPKGAVHICYCFTPMRYAWGFFEEYFGQRGKISRGLIKIILEKLRRWDLSSNSGVDCFVAISEHVKKRIHAHYHRNAEVIYPPVDTDFYTPGEDNKKEDFYLIVSALVPYKKIDLAVEAFSRLNKKLLIIGDGPERKKLEKRSKKNIQFLGWQSNESIRGSYRKAKALIFPGEEDFGIVPVEMQACGGVVIAFGKGGALETVKDMETGVFFNESSPEGLARGVEKFENHTFSPETARANALKFNRGRFMSEISELVAKISKEKKTGLS